MRIIENNYRVKLVETGFKTMAVDNEEDREKVEKALFADSLFAKYKTQENER